MTKLLLNPLPCRNVSRSAIWKKNGRLSVGGEMSSATSSTAGPGPPGAASLAKYGVIASVGVSTGSKCWRLGLRRGRGAVGRGERLAG